MCIVHVVAFVIIFLYRMRRDPSSVTAMVSYIGNVAHHHSLGYRLFFQLPVISTHIIMYVRSVGMDFFFFCYYYYRFTRGKQRYPERPRRTRET